MTQGNACYHLGVKGCHCVKRAWLGINNACDLAFYYTHVIAHQFRCLSLYVFMPDWCPKGVLFSNICFASQSLLLRRRARVLLARLYVAQLDTPP
jgi:hypothetical protein